MSLATIAMLQFSVAGPLAGTAQAHDDKGKARTPIKHVIVIVGENRTFDHIFATYVPKRGQTVNNLLSAGIIDADGAPGKNYSKAEQFSADVTPGGDFELAPKKKDLYSHLPAPLNGGPTDVCKDNGVCTLADATSSEAGLSDGPMDPNCRVECTVDYYDVMLTGGTGLSGKVPDTRIDGVHGSPRRPMHTVNARVRNLAAQSRSARQHEVIIVDRALDPAIRVHRAIRQSGLRRRG